MTKEIFYFQIDKPNYSFSFSMLSDGKTHIMEKTSGEKEKTEKQISETEIKAFFAGLEKLGFYSWPPNMDCCACDDSSYTVMADYEGRKKDASGCLVLSRTPGLTYLNLLKGVLIKKYGFKFVCSVCANSKK